MLFQIIATLIWASAFIAAKYTYEMMDPVLMVQCRFFIASIIMLPGFFAAYKRVPKERLKIMWLLALINFPLMFLLQFIGLYFTSAASAVTMLGMIPLLTVLIGFLFFKRRINKIDLLLSLVALAGIILTVVGGGEDNLINPWGCLLVLGSAVSFCFCLYLSKDVMQEMAPKDYTNVLVILGSILCLPFTCVLVRDWSIVPSVKGMISLFYLGIGCTWLAVVLWFKGGQKTPTYISSILTTLEPIFGVILAILILDERLSAVSAMGILLTLGAAAVSVLIPVLMKKSP
ncbi:DMT family transporter [Basfia succiniciproducens]|uniref:DMT family transporter n=1 Tax=Basfia succiniciproducens TaxID=653940 RepID=UPI0008BCE18C|nr:EamA family transporter [Basfia succiniciproducens]SEQ57228.1 Threonine/homoserine efflux transporter RhtA [Basfia succiniciproducens]